MIDPKNLGPALLPPLPPEAVTFDAIDWGGYTPRGYSPCVRNGVIRGLAIALLKDAWLIPTDGSGRTIVLHDKSGTVLGRINVPSLHAAQYLREWPAMLTFTPEPKTATK